MGLRDSFHSYFGRVYSGTTSGVFEAELRHSNSVGLYFCFPGMLEWAGLIVYAGDGFGAGSELCRVEMTNDI